MVGIFFIILSSIGIALSGSTPSLIAFATAIALILSLLANNSTPLLNPLTMPKFTSHFSGYCY